MCAYVKNGTVSSTIESIISLVYDAAKHNSGTIGLYRRTSPQNIRSDPSLIEKRLGLLRGKEFSVTLPTPGSDIFP